MSLSTAIPRVLGLAVLVLASPASLADNGPATSPAAAPASPPRFAPWTSEVLKLVEAGLEEPVLLAFIETAGTFNLTADQIVELSRQGMTSRVITAMLQHDLEVAAGLRPPATLAVPPSAPVIRMTFRPAEQRSAASQPGGQTGREPTTVTLDAPANARLTASAPEASPGSVQCAPASLPAGAEPVRESATAAAPGPQPPAPEAATRSYPVREPYPVPLAPPLLLVSAAGRTPNLIVIELFPSTAR